jgi:hypothetical protein
MHDNKPALNPRRGWQPGLLRKIVVATASKMLSHGISAPPPDFFDAVAGRSEEIILEAIAGATAASHDDTDTLIANIRVATAS